ncbi:hypothetical protein D3C75_565870 [compost metagenome]
MQGDLGEGDSSVRKQIVGIVIIQAVDMLNESRCIEVHVLPVYDAQHLPGLPELLGLLRHGPCAVNAVFGIEIAVQNPSGLLQEHPIRSQRKQLLQIFLIEAPGVAVAHIVHFLV